MTVHSNVWVGQGLQKQDEKLTPITCQSKLIEQRNINANCMSGIFKR